LLRNRFETDAESLQNHCAIVAGSLCDRLRNRCGITAELLRNAARLLRNRFETDAESLQNHCAIVAESLCDRLRNRSRMVPIKRNDESN
jgi:hypothetical protein